MKNFKKVASIILALVMAFAMTSIAFAATNENNGSITITNALPGHEYSIYRIFDLVSYDKEANSYNYQVNSDWAAFTTDPKFTKCFSVGTGHVEAKTGVTSSELAEFAKDALEWATAHSIDPVATETAGAAAEGATTTTVEFNNLTLGYYLVDSSVGSLCILDTTNPDAEIEDKNEVPTLTKEVQENSTTTWGQKNDASVGRAVNFRIRVDAKEGAAGYVIHDKMSEGLTFKPESVTISCGEGNLTKDVDYTVVTGDDLDDDCTFEIVFSEDFLDEILDDDEIVVLYSAVLNDKAVVGLPGNPNESHLEYGEEHKSETTPVETITYTWEFDINKVGEINGTQTPLAGAKFTISGTANDTKPIRFYVGVDEEDGSTYYEACIPDANGLPCGHSNEEHVTELVSPEDGKIIVKGLDALTYTLTETEAPDGYNKLTTPISFRINRVGNYTGATVSTTGTSASAEGTAITVVNKTGTELPSTGGIGTTIFYVIGGLLVAAAAVLLITKRRMAAAK